MQVPRSRNSSETSGAYARYGNSIVAVTKPVSYPPAFLPELPGLLRVSSCSPPGGAAFAKEFTPSIHFVNCKVRQKQAVLIF